MKSRISLIFLGLIACVVMSACGGDDDDDNGAEPANTPSASQGADIANVVQRVATSGPENLKFVLGHTTDNYLTEVLGRTREQCDADPFVCLDGRAIRAVAGRIRVDGNRATAVVSLDQPGALRDYGFTLVREDEVWKVDGYTVLDDEAPEGVERLDLQLVEYEFQFTEPILGGRPIAVENAGDEEHELVLLALPEDVDAEDVNELNYHALAVEAGFKGPFKPGDRADLYVPALAAGRYMLACFLVDEPMFTEFSVGE